MRTELHLRQPPSSIVKRDMASLAGIRPRIVCGLVKQLSVAKPFWMNVGRLMRTSLLAN